MKLYWIWYILQMFLFYLIKPSLLVPKHKKNKSKKKSKSKTNSNNDNEICEKAKNIIPGTKIYFSFLFLIFFQILFCDQNMIICLSGIKIQYMYCFFFDIF